jgi:hypothetical protein
MANNDLLYNAAVAAAVAGALHSQPGNYTAANFANLVLAAAAFATRVDSKIAVDATITTPVTDVCLQKVMTLALICNAFEAGRTLSSTTAADYDAIAVSIAAAYTQALTALV